MQFMPLNSTAKVSFVPVHAHANAQSNVPLVHHQDSTPRKQCENIQEGWSKIFTVHWPHQEPFKEGPSILQGVQGACY
jgi:hypothetical protein